MTYRASIIIIAMILLESVFASAQTSGPVQVSPTNGAILHNGCPSQRDPIRWEFQWQPVQGAQTYRLYIKRTGSMSKLLDLQTRSTSFSRNSVAYIAPQNLDGWRWSVRALVEGKWSAWTTSNFSVEPLGADCITR